jgi:IS30 family transposase
MQQRLTFYEREQIELFVRQRLGIREIGRPLERDRQTTRHPFDPRLRGRFH